MEEKTMKRILAITVITILIVGTFSMTALAGGWGPGPGKEKVGFGCRFSDLDLTLAQEQKILEIRQEFQKETLPLRFEMRKKMEELRQLWAQNSPNQSLIDAKNKEITPLKIQLRAKAEAMQEKIKGVLTAEQLKKLNENGFKGKGFRGPGRPGSGCMGCPGL